MTLKSLIAKPFSITALVISFALLISGVLDLWLGSSIAVLMILQLAVVVIALQCSPGWAYLSAVFEAVCFNFFLTNPRFSLQMLNVDDIVNLCVFLIVAIITSKLAEYYRQQQNQLKQAQLRNSILLSVSHDLRTPLATIIGTLSTLEEYMDKLSKAEKAELFDSAIVESNRLYQYIENLLQATKLQHGAVVLKKDEHSLVHIIHLVIERFSKQTDRIILDAQSDLPSVQMSSSLIQQAIFNVIDNALRYSPYDKNVNINIYRSSEHLIVDIKDEGVGITKEQSEHIFDLFYSASSPKRNDSGTGLGLAVSKGIISAHQGTMQAVPVDSGSLIRIQLPMVNGGQHLVL
ncbi:ATP-binding protein [Photobacterium profundum]|uniref:histidine kinase n=1 Tax=Photobacterium profundum (strain SS9) TaxID=298386 RepID=Q6LKJ9_PHOPR|nr:ATP-binding protein [Photobacterium profundum]CAG22201.1 hypothetical sensor histidine kinase [Photobacterium profundum SS9]